MNEKVQQFIINLFQRGVPSGCLACQKYYVLEKAWRQMYGKPVYYDLMSSMEERDLKILAQALQEVGFEVGEIRKILRAETRDEDRGIGATDEQLMNGKWHARRCVLVHEIVEAVQKRYPDPPQ